MSCDPRKLEGEIPVKGTGDNFIILISVLYDALFCCPVMRLNLFMLCVTYGIILTLSLFAEKLPLPFKYIIQQKP